MQFEEMKYSGEAKMSSGQRMLEEFQAHLTEGEKRLVMYLEWTGHAKMHTAASSLLIRSFVFTV